MGPSILSGGSASACSFAEQKWNRRVACIAQHVAGGGRFAERASGSRQHRGTACRAAPAAAPLAGLPISLEDCSDADLCAYICRGPLMRKSGIKPEDVLRDLDTWKDLGRKLVEQIGLNVRELTEPDMARLFHYYLPAFMWCWRQLREHKTEHVKKGMTPSALLIGMSAPQGCGKSTLVESLETLFEYVGSRAAVISVDDFYLTYEGQNRLADEHPENRLLELRGNAGSHDLQLGTKTITALKQLTRPGFSLRIPRYNKSAYGGRGDRKDPAKWPEIQSPIEVILFEGWMLGFEPLPTEKVMEVDPQLGKVNEYLKDYHEAWHKHIDSWMVIEVQDPNWVFNWRLEAEVMMRASGKDGMTDEQVEDFVSRYIPAYKAYLPPLYSKGPRGSTPLQLLRIAIDQNRNPLG
ncbi:Glycerate 3-kinase (GlyK) [Chara braunii]|uniref:Glycerate 3-kinase (GlyK) n=1 Tax=Chara braunii TaxID=69332 RepID=A0A388JP50_CHABU|nr:Glycerate 3-kinase (GlyK) [Chara braunii]|eukprot:GBG59596.1 Glycerate 3-kinase (GlyK) [Chara braunii]